MWLEVVHSNNDPYTVAHHYLDCVRYSFYFYLVTDFVFLLFIFVNCQVCNCKNTCSRKQSKRSAGCSCINVNEKCGARCKCCTSKLQCRKGKQENIELQNAQRLPASAFDRHSEYIVNATEEIKAC